ncbi:MAG: hypothetical protein ACOC1P_02930 [Minisyncoccales bacterium]
MTISPIGVSVYDSVLESIYQIKDELEEDSFYFYKPRKLSEVVEARVTNGRGYACSKHPSRKKDKFPCFLDELKKGYPDYHIIEAS